MAWGPGAHERIVVASSIPLRVVLTGDGHRSPLLLINGLGASVEMWRPFVRHLDERRVIAFDLPGAGQSGRGRRPLRMRALAALVVELLDELQLPGVDVLGYSLGGLVAQELAYRAPDRVRRLVLCATTPGVPSVAPNPLMAMLMLSPARYYDRRLAGVVVPLIAGGRTARDRRVLRARLVERLADPPTPVGYLHQLYAVSGWSSHLWLRRLRPPALVVQGDDDPLVPLPNARYLAHAIPDARLHVVRGGGHLFLFDEPERAVPAIVDFLDAPP